MSVKFPSHNVADALERSLKNADGLKAVNSAVVAAARVLAGRIDFLPTFLKYCQSLGLTLDAPAKVGRPARQKPEVRAEEAKSDKVIAMDDFMKRFG